MAKRRVFILIPNLLANDAVGNDALGMSHALSAAGYDARLVAGQIHAYQSEAVLLDSDPNEPWLDPDAVIVYHHAIEWIPGERALDRARGRIVIKHHNVTPPRFFTRYSQHHVQSCTNGIEMTRRLAGKRLDFIWGASQFNSDEFRRLGVPADRCRALPPFHHVEKLGRCPLDAPVLGKYRGAAANILFVGAFRPNKGHFRALEVLSDYRRLRGRPARLLFVGSYEPAMEQYVEELRMYARHLELEDSLTVCKSVSMAELRSFYLTADVFLCVSEHEGFCVPLVEALYFRTPIVAWASSAVGETCGGSGIVHTDFDAKELARAVDGCLADPLLARKLASEGRLRYEQAFHPDAIRKKLLGLMEEVERL